MEDKFPDGLAFRPFMKVCLEWGDQLNIPVRTVASNVDFDLCTTHSPTLLSPLQGQGHGMPKQDSCIRVGRLICRHGCINLSINKARFKSR